MKLFVETALIISFDKSFHIEAIRLLKKLKRWSQLLFNSLMSCPLRSPRGGALIGGYDHSTSSNLFSILYFCIRSPHFLLVCKFVRPKILHTFNKIQLLKKHSSKITSDSRYFHRWFTNIKFLKFCCSFQKQFCRHSMIKRFTPFSFYVSSIKIKQSFFFFNE